MFSLTYAWDELRRRWSRTVVTAIGLAAGVGLVMGIIGVSNGLTRAQNRVLSPLSSVGTDIIVTRTVGATMAGASTTPTTPTTTTPGLGGIGGSGGAGIGGGGGFFAAGGRGAAGQLAQLNASDQAALLNANSSVLTDLSKLGPPGTAFTYDFFVPGTLITFPDAAVSDVRGLRDVASAVPGLSLQAIHESGTVPQVTDTFTTGGQTITSVQQPSPLTAAEEEQVRQCLINSGAISSSAPAPAGSGGAGGAPTGGGPGAATSDRAGFGGRLTACLPQRFQQYVAQVVVPAQTINRVLNPPQTDTQTKSYTVAGVDPANTTTGLITKSQLSSGTWFTADPADELLVGTAYASTNGIKVGQQLTIDKITFTVVGLVNPTLTGDTADLYFDLPTLQSLASNQSRVNEVLVKVKSSNDVASVAAAIHKLLPGAQVLTSRQLAGQVSGSLANAHTLATHLGGALAVIVLLAAFLIAALLTMSSVSKRVREIGTLRAVGWSRGRVVRQVLGETLGIGLIGAVLGVAVGVGVCALIGAVGPALTSTTSGTAVGASSVGSIFHQAATASSSAKIHLAAPLDLAAVLLGLAAAVVGGLLAGLMGGWRASRLAPASALRDLG
jgi:ABC-type antimicrobial peptide transport system permease subunit